MHNHIPREVLSLPAAVAKGRGRREINPALPQQLLTIVADTSGSMHGAPINEVNRHAAELAHECSQDPLTRESLQVQLVAFGAAIRVHPFVPITQFAPPPLTASGGTPLAEALLVAVAETARHIEFVRKVTEGEILKPHYFLFTDGQATSPPDVIAQAAACVRGMEKKRQGAFYAFATDTAALDAIQPLFPRKAHVLPTGNFGAFFRIISVSVCRVSVSCVSEDLDLTRLIESQLRLPYQGNNDA